MFREWLCVEENGSGCVRMKEKGRREGKGRALSTQDLRLLDGAISTAGVSIDGEIYHE